VDGQGKRARTGELSPLVTRILMVATIAALAGTLYLLVSAPRGGAPYASPVSVSITRDATNWTVTLTGVPGGHLPAEMYLLIRNGSGAIVLARTPFSILTLADWPRNGIAYLDGNPSVQEVRAGDHLRIDVQRFPAASVIEISDRSALLLIQALVQ